jgi:heme-degrading monooxygenase HmoA
VLIKWIKCKVPKHQKQSFSRAQEQWKELHGIAGFLGQVGGWNPNNPSEACVLAFWNNLASYQSFMKNEHDAIFEKSGQQHTYESIRVKMYETIQNAPSLSERVVYIVEKSKILHVTEYMLHSSDNESFEQKVSSTQDENGVVIWGRGCRENICYLLVSMGEIDKQRSEKGQEWANLHQDTAEMSEVIVFLEDMWRVT